MAEIYRFIVMKINFYSALGIQYAMISLKIVLANLLRHYKFTTELKMSDLKFKFELTLKPAFKYAVRIEKHTW